MTENDVINEYFEWLFAAVNGDQRHRRSPYRKLITLLHQTDFSWTIPMDANRAADGKELRHRFSQDIGVLSAYQCLDGPCSVLEMMVALSIRCENNIMSNPDVGDRTALWFWGMVKNLGLDKFTDAKFDRVYCINSLNRFLSREYDADGRYGLFPVPGCSYDLRTVEIWYQMCWFLNTIVGDLIL